MALVGSGRRSMQPLRILLAGVDGFYNYGCEAIVRGTIQMLREKWPDCRITVASGYVDRDAAVLRDLDGVTVTKLYQRVTWKRVGRGILRRIGIGSGSPIPLHCKLSEGFDLSLSVGGDNYSLAVDNAGVSHLVSELMKWGEASLENGCQHVLWGASVGPFEACPHVRDRMAVHLRKLSLITAREPITYAYLRELGCKENTVLVADPAFAMKPSIEKSYIEHRENKLTVGVNVSELALRQVHKGDAAGYENGREALANAIKAIVGMKNVRVLLVPHVTGYGCLFDDHVFMRELLHDVAGRIQLLPSGLGAQKTKAVLAACDLVVAARMHCAVGALSVGVPTLMLTYSRKGPGMSRYVYGSDDYAVALNEISPEILLEKVRWMLERRTAIYSTLEANRCKWEIEARKAVIALGSLV